MHLSLAVLLFFLVSLTGCADRGDEISRNQVEAALADTLAAESRELVEKLASRFKTFGGAYVDSAGVRHVFVTDTTERNAITQLLETAGTTDAEDYRARPRSGGIQYHRAEHTYKQLAAWSDEVYRELIGVPGLGTVQVFQRCNCIVAAVSFEESVAIARDRIAAAKIPKTAVHVHVAKFSPL